MGDPVLEIIGELSHHISQHWGSIQQAFLKVDTDRSGSITADEFGAILKIFNVNVSAEDLDILVDAFDANQDGRVSYEEFCTTLESGPYLVEPELAPAPVPPMASRAAPAKAKAAPAKAKAAPPAPKTDTMDSEKTKQLMASLRRAVGQCFNSLYEAFLHIDTDRSGYISAQELIALLYSHNVDVSWTELQQLMEVMDTNGDGIISYNEFCQAIDGQSLLQGSKARAAPKAAPQPPAPQPPAQPPAGEADMAHTALRKWVMTSCDTLREAFLKINRSRSGVITTPELAAVTRASPGAVQQMMEVYDLNRDGVIQYNEFVKAMSYDGLY